MTIQELKAQVDAYRENLAGKSGKVIVANESGPAGMPLIDAIVSVLETHAAQIEQLKRGL